MWHRQTEVNILSEQNRVRGKTKDDGGDNLSFQKYDWDRNKKVNEMTKMVVLMMMIMPKNSETCVTATKDWQGGGTLESLSFQWWQGRQWWCHHDKYDEINDEYDDEDGSLESLSLKNQSSLNTAQVLTINKTRWRSRWWCWSMYGWRNNYDDDDDKNAGWHWWRDTNMRADTWKYAKRYDEGISLVLMKLRVLRFHFLKYFSWYNSCSLECVKWQQIHERQEEGSGTIY